MALISLDLNQAHSTASTFQSSGQSMDELSTHLQRQWTRLVATWEGDSKHETEAEVRALLNRCGQVAQLTKERGVKMTQIADRFEAADNNVAFAVTKVTWQSEQQGRHESGVDGIANPADAEALKHAKDILSKTSIGRQSIKDFEKFDIKFKLGKPGSKTYYCPEIDPPNCPEGDTIYINPSEDAETTAKSFIHEMTHAIQDKTNQLVNANDVDCDTYVRNRILSEADAIMAAHKYDMERSDTETNYETAYNQELTYLRQTMPGKTESDYQRMTEEYMRSAVIERLVKGETKTMGAGDKEQTYMDFYREEWFLSQRIPITNA